MRRYRLITQAAIASAIAVLILAPDTARAQGRPSASPDGAAPASFGAPRGLPRRARLPFAGVWDGLFRVPAPDGSASRPMPVVMVFDVTDSARSSYSRSTVLPNGARAPHLETTVASGEMHWKQQNSGGGSGTFALAHRTPGA
jgi:hypothetical protein